jgi:hypothetical protein
MYSGALFAIGRQPDFAAGSRLLEEGLATCQAIDTTTPMGSSFSKYLRLR